MRLSDTPPRLRVLSLGAGVQSTTLYLMSCLGELERLDCAIFADTQWEPQAVYRHLEWLESLDYGIPISRVTAGNLRQDVLNALGTTRVGHIGQPPLFVRQADTAARAQGRALDTGGQLWRKCTTEYKLAPIEREIRRLLGVPPRKPVPKGVQVEQWLGISLDEFHRMKDYGKHWIRRRWPLIERRMTRQDCLLWLHKHGFPRPPKSSCIGCPFHSNSYWVEMRRRRPEAWADAVAFDAQLRTGKLPGVTGDAYLHRRMLPLPEAVAMDAEPHKNQEAFPFMDECEGVCFT